MSKVMTAEQFIAKAKEAANSKTLYVMGCFGAPMNEKNKKRYSTNNEFNRTYASKILAADGGVFGFDCVCLVKGLLWGWRGDRNAQYGGAVYASNGVPDIGEDAMIKKCSDVSTDFSKIVPGAFLWMKGHCGIYIGNGLAVEATPKWKWKVQITAVANIGPKAGYNSRTWTKWGKLPWIDYTEKKPEPIDLKKKVPVNVDGKIVECTGNIVDGITYIQLRDLARMGLADVSWDANERIPIVKRR